VPGNRTGDSRVPDSLSCKKGEIEDAMTWLRGNRDTKRLQRKKKEDRCVRQ
jgi:predicted phosphodiesterase